MEQNYENSFLARWLSGKLTEEELQAFEKTEEYQQYKEIIDTTDLASFPKYDEDANFEATLQKIKNQPRKLTSERSQKYKWLYAVAASVILFFGYTAFFQTTDFTTQFAENKRFELPDGSEVHLNAASKVNYKTFNWKNNRKLSLEGEAFFKVKKGSSFVVETKEGNVTVLGTQFKVNSRQNLYEVTCFEGKVQVIVQEKDTLILTKGDALILQEKELKTFEVKQEKPDWLLKESSFNKVHIFEVVAELERQYNIKIQGKENLKSAYFSGRFRHDNLKNAVETIFSTMDIPYLLNSKGTIVIQKY